MNPINLIMNYLIADSRIKHYNVSEKEKVQTTALVIGAFSQNPLIDYMIIDNQAKNLQQKNDTGTCVSLQSPNASEQPSKSDDTNQATNSSNEQNKTEELISAIDEINSKIDDLIADNTNLWTELAALKTKTDSYIQVENKAVIKEAKTSGSEKSTSTKK